MKLEKTLSEIERLSEQLDKRLKKKKPKKISLIRPWFMDEIIKPQVKIQANASK
jgi:hypothetical protein